jgi:hypothetical protein
MAASDEFYTAPRLSSADFNGHQLEFESAVQSPHSEKIASGSGCFQRARTRRRRRARCSCFPSGIGGGSSGSVRDSRASASRPCLVLPYHGAAAADLLRADYIVAPTSDRRWRRIGRPCRAARVDWLQDQLSRIGIMGASLGSCLSMQRCARLTHSRRRFQPSPRGSPTSSGAGSRCIAPDSRATSRSTPFATTGPISPWPFIDRVRTGKVFDLRALRPRFPVDLSRSFLAEFDRRGVCRHRRASCSHYTTGKTPFKFSMATHRSTSCESLKQRRVTTGDDRRRVTAGDGR